MIIKSFSSILPYRVIEALSTSNFSNASFKNLTARITKNGWAWFIIGRKLFIWRYLDEDYGSKMKASKCYELLLPASDLALHADLIWVQNSLHSRFPCALAVSPEGSIRYWPNVFQSNNFIDSVLTWDLNGQECQILIEIQPLGYILGTTTNSLVHISLDRENHQSINCNVLKPPQGLFSGISKKFSHFIFGSLPTAQMSETRQLIRVIKKEPIFDTDEILPIQIYVLFNNLIQKWVIEDYGIENFCGDCDLEKHLKEAFINKFWNRSTTHHNQISIWIMDIVLNQSDEIVLLVVGNNSDLPNENSFGLITLFGNLFVSNQSSIESPIKSFLHLRNIFLTNDHSFTVRSSMTSSRYHPFNLIYNLHNKSHRSNDRQSIYLFNSNKLYLIEFETNDDHQDAMEIDFQSNNDCLLGVSLADESLFLLTLKNGFVTIESNSSSQTSIKNLSNSDKEMIVSGQSNEFSLMKKIINLFVKGEKTRAKLMMEELFPFLSQSASITSSETKSIDRLNDMVVMISADICDHIPHADPRWSDFIEAENSVDSLMMRLEDSGSGSVSGSVMISNQLEEKLSFHQQYIDLLRQTHVWELLQSSTSNESRLPTRLILCEHIEKLLACLSLKKLQSRFGAIIEQTMKQVLQKRNLATKLENSHLTNQDLFYSKATKVDDFFWELIDLEQKEMNLDHSNPDENLIIAVTDIITNVFGEICLYRQTNGSIYGSIIIADCDFIVWNSEQHHSGIRDCWVKQLDFFVRCFQIDSTLSAISVETDDERWNQIGQRLNDLTDIICDNFVLQLKYLTEGNEKHSTLRRQFESIRSKCLESLLRIKQYNRVALLAEKYEDFDILIKLCEETDNQDQLNHYTKHFECKGFSKNLFEWYLKEGKQAKMLSSSTISSNDDLDEFLKNHDTLKWLHQLHIKKFSEASQTLEKLSSLEDQCPQRRKTMISIAKLASLASDHSSPNTNFDDQLRLLDYQLNLSDEILKKNSLERNSMKVLKPRNLIEILISGDDNRPNEDLLNFKSALDIVDILRKYETTELIKELELLIWRQAFQKDDWHLFNTDSPDVYIRRSFIFQLALSYFNETDKKLPELEPLMKNFALIDEDPKASFFFRAAHEMIQNKH
ncbi:hypothetical protein NH340_JMT02708 [Sarcoptes scabiei]|nr:hypothetical protein NH340_JMT02708 [Sarcoptes scabiei]